MLSKLIDPSKVEKFSGWIKKYSKFVIIGHVSPDGDAVGSTLALCHYLRSKGKKAQVVMPNAFPDFLKWLPGSEDVKFYRLASYDRSGQYRIGPLIEKADVICCLDFNALSRINEIGEMVKNSRAKKLLLDHHLDPADFADITISHSEQSSTCELLFRFLCDLGHFDDMTADEATCIYTGMMTDTGGFTYNSSRSDIFYIIGLLLTKGIDKDVIYRKVFYNYTAARIMLQGAVLSSMTYLPEYHTAILTLSKEQQKEYHYIRGDSEGFVNIPLAIKDVVLTCFLREDTERNEIKMSLRSVGDFSCEQLARRFGGGGHKNASGAEQPGKTLEEVKQAFISLLDDFKEKLEEGYQGEVNSAFAVVKS